MPRQTRATLKQYFEKRDKPTQGQFSDLIDSFINIEDAGMVGVLYPKLQWLTATEYVQGDIVYDAGNSYLCRVDHTSEAVRPEADSTNWMKLVAKGDNAYLYVAYASDSSGTDFTLTFDANLDYIAILNSEVAIPSPSVEDFVGLWKKYKGDQGVQGIAATVTIGTVTTLPAGSSATVENVGTEEDAILNFGIPEGEDGLVTTVVGGTKINVDLTDPTAPVVSLVLGEDDNFMTDAEKANSHAPGSDDQDLSVLIPKSIGTAEGDLIIFSGNGAPIRLAKGSADQVLVMKADGTRPEWRTQAAGADVLQMQIFS